MIKIFKLKRTGGYQHYYIKSRKGYTIIKKYKGKNVWAKISEVIEAPPIKEKPPIPTKHTIVKVFLKDDYGKTGHHIWFDCWVTRIFETDAKAEIRNWITLTKQYMRDKILEYGNMINLSEYIYGIELDDIEKPTTESIGLQEENFEYSHNGKKWFKIR